MWEKIIFLSYVGVCYIPPELRKKEQDLEAPQTFSNDQLQLINHRNLQLVNKLRTLDSAFSLGDGGLGKYK